MFPGKKPSLALAFWVGKNIDPTNKEAKETVRKVGEKSDRGLVQGWQRAKPLALD